MLQMLSDVPVARAESAAAAAVRKHDEAFGSSGDGQIAFQGYTTDRDMDGCLFHALSHFAGHGFHDIAPAVCRVASDSRSNWTTS